MNKIIFVLLPAWASAAIHVDQFGYLANSRKIATMTQAVVGADSLSNGQMPDLGVELVEMSTGSVVRAVTASPWSGGGVHAQSGDKVWLLDFSSVTAMGRYQLRSANEWSPIFEIRENPYRSVLRAATKVFFYQRSGFAKDAKFAGANWADGAAFLGARQDLEARSVFDSTNPGSARDVHGGWFDAGDYNKYITFAAGPVHDLLDAYGINPGIWSDDFDLPESGNGLPDLLDGLKWELDWMRRMQDVDGGVWIKTGASSHSSASPPSADKTARYYGKKCGSSSVALAGVFAHAATVYRAFPAWQSYADSLRIRAEKAWQWYKANPRDTACDQGEIKAGDADWSLEDQDAEEAVVGAWMFDLTGDLKWDQVFLAKYQSVGAMGWWGPYGAHRGSALLRYNELAQANSTAKTKIIAAKSRAANLGFYGNDLGSDPFGLNLPDAQYHWGSSTVQAQAANVNLEMVRYGIVADQQPYLDRALATLHYMHGNNPLGKIYLTNMSGLGGENSVVRMYHSWFGMGTPWDSVGSVKGGPPPAYVVGGPNKDFSNASIKSVYHQPPMKSYADINGGYPINSWELTEPAIYYQASYIKLLSYFVNGSADVLASRGVGSRDGYRDWVDVKGRVIGGSGAAAKVPGAYFSDRAMGVFLP